VVTRDGWMKRVGEVKDPNATRVREGDQAKWVLRGNTRDNLALFSNLGVAYVMKVANVPASTGYGEPVQSLLNFADGERIVAAALLQAAAGADSEGGAAVSQGELFAPGAAAEQQPPARVVLSGAEQPILVTRWLVATAGGMGFFARPDLSETTRSGRRFARTKAGDALVSVAPASGDTVTAVSAGGHVLVFPADELAELAGPGRGVILMRLDKDDALAAAACQPADRGLTVIGEDGSERRLSAPEPAHRAQKGRRALKRIKVVDLR
jgi:DNA gyrase subunit A